MAIYVFNLVVGFFPNGVDHAQGYRARMLKNFSKPVRWIFTEVPEKRDIDYYERVGIDADHMRSVHQYLTDHELPEPFAALEDKLKELRSGVDYTDEERRENVVRLIKKGFVVVEIRLDKNDRDSFCEIHFLRQGKLIRREVYTDILRYADSYVTVESDNGSYARLARRSFYNSDGSVAYDRIYDGNEERYVFPDGRFYTKSELMAEFVKKLNLSEDDIVLLDRSAQSDFVQPLFRYAKKARIITVFHSEHFFEKGYDSRWSNINLNWEYLYWFKYTKQIEAMVVATEEQKKDLMEKLSAYGCRIPDILAIPPKGIEGLRYPETQRRSFSLVTASRIVPGKRIDWVIRSVIMAHQINEEITLDIYGDGEAAYVQSLKNIIADGQAQSYIHFWGWRDVTEVYKNYEVYISASLRESMGLSVMEAIGSGAAVIGLDVRYGNRLCIHSRENGYLIDFDQSYPEGDDHRLIDDMAKKIVEIFADKDRLEKFHRYSYAIAEKFSPKIIAESWKKLLA